MFGLDPLSMGMGVLDGGFKIFNGIKQLGQAGKIKPQYTPYTTSPYATQQLGIAQQMFNARMPGAGALENNIGAAQSNATANAQRNATDGAQALAVGNAAQLNANNAYNQLSIQEAQNKQAMLGNLNNALGTMTNEHDKVYQDKLQKYQQDLQMKAALQAGGMTNIGNGINAIGSGAMMGMTGGASGGASGLGSFVNPFMGGGRNAQLASIPQSSASAQLPPSYLGASLFMPKMFI